MFSYRFRPSTLQRRIRLNTLLYPQCPCIPRYASFSPSTLENSVFKKQCFQIAPLRTAFSNGSVFGDRFRFENGLVWTGPKYTCIWQSFLKAFYCVDHRFQLVNLLWDQLLMASLFSNEFWWKFILVFNFRWTCSGSLDSGSSGSSWSLGQGNSGGVNKCNTYLWGFIPCRLSTWFHTKFTRRNNSVLINVGWKGNAISSILAPMQSRSSSISFLTTHACHTRDSREFRYRLEFDWFLKMMKLAGTWTPVTRPNQVLDMDIVWEPSGTREIEIFF